MENLKIFSCSESAEKFTEEVCNYLKIEKGKIWTSDNVLFQWAVASDELKEVKSKSKLSKFKIKIE